jgi:hypothetical protein
VDLLDASYAADRTRHKSESVEVPRA